MKICNICHKTITVNAEYRFTLNMHNGINYYNKADLCDMCGCDIIKIIEEREQKYKDTHTED
jgi:hypothetical protein